jgi:4-amino-4-deoxy-L-arabinose transferase-like glycosyltransferase
MRVKSVAEFSLSPSAPESKTSRLFGENPPLMSDRTCRAILVLVMTAGAILRLWGLRFGFPHPVARPDEEVIVDTALGVLRDPNPHFFDWPTLFIYVTAAAYAVLFAVERAIGGAIRHATLAKAAFEPVLHLIPRALSATAGILTIAALFGAARELFSRRVALVAAGFLAVAFLHVRDSHFGVTDVPVTFLTVCAFWAGIRCATRGVTQARVAIAGLLCGLATSTKYNAALVLLPAVVAIVSEIARERPRSTVLAVRAVAVLLLCAASGFLAGTPFALLDHRTFWAAVTTVRSHLAGGHVVMARNGWTYHAAFSFRYGLGFPLVVAACLGGCWLVKQRTWAAALVLAFPVPYYVLLGSGQTVFVRYMIPTVPFLCLTAAFFVDRAGESFGNLFKNRRARDVATVALAAIIAAPTAWTSLAFDRLMARSDTRVLGADWIVSQFPSGASMYQTGFGSGHLQPRPRGRYPQYRFNERANRFELDERPAADLPDLVVMLESPLGTYSQIAPQIAPLVAEHYVLAMTFDGVPAASASGAVYDQEDAFFAPFGGIENVTRPGPNVSIFERRRRR